MNVLLSVKPKYANMILNGTKQYEFRKSNIKRINEVNKVYIYSTSPVKKVIGTFKVSDVLIDRPEKLWERCNGSSGMSKKEFFNYFAEKEIGYAFKIENIKILEPFNINEGDSNYTAPQSFCYVYEDWIKCSVPISV